MEHIIKPPKLNRGDTIGLLAPSYAQNPANTELPIKTLISLGFNIKLSEHIYSSAHGYSGSTEERADDFNAMIVDNDVKMLLFGGGEVCNEILPLIDYKNIRRNPKIICSYSDSTTILNAVYHKSSIVTFYGASLRTFESLTDYNHSSFESRIMTEGVTDYIKGSEWRAITSGQADGILIGGYLANFAAMLGGNYFGIDKNEKYILFIEDHKKFSTPAIVSKWFSHISQSGILDNVTGLIFGHYSTDETPQIDDILKRFGQTHKIPVVRCEDFGHGVNNSVLPIGIRAAFDTSDYSFKFLESGIQ